MERQKNILKKIILYLALVFLVIIWIIPIFTLFATAIKSKVDFLHRSKFV